MNKIDYALKELSAYKKASTTQLRSVKKQANNNNIILNNSLEVSKEQDELLLALNMELLNLKYNLTEE